MQGATPNKIMPAMYSLILRGSTKSANKTLKNNQPKPAIVKGLMSQLMMSVSHRSLVFFPVFLIEAKSI